MDFYLYFYVQFFSLSFYLLFSCTNICCGCSKKGRFRINLLYLMLCVLYRFQLCGSLIYIVVDDVPNVRTRLNNAKCIMSMWRLMQEGKKREREKNNVRKRPLRFFVEEKNRVCFFCCWNSSLVWMCDFHVLVCACWIEKVCGARSWKNHFSNCEMLTVDIIIAHMYVLMTNGATFFLRLFFALIRLQRIATMPMWVQKPSCSVGHSELRVFVERLETTLWETLDHFYIDHIYFVVLSCAMRYIQTDKNLLAGMRAYQAYTHRRTPFLPVFLFFDHTPNTHFFFLR